MSKELVQYEVNRWLEAYNDAMNPILKIQALIKMIILIILFLF